LLVAIHGGFFSVSDNSVQVLAEVAELGEDIDLDRAKAALARAQADTPEPDDAAIRRAETRITVAGLASTIR
jgi:F-type H+-transporting ATPase subunit epsilon